MQRVHYAGDTLLTGNELSKALLEYAEALARSSDSATVDLPTRNDDGSIGRVNILIGPASQIISVAEASAFDEIVDEALVELLKQKSALLGPSRAVVGDVDDSTAKSAEDLELPREMN